MKRDHWGTTFKGRKMGRLTTAICLVAPMLMGEAHAQTAVRTDEIPLVISASGFTHTAPDKIALTILVNASGDSDAAARAQNAEKVQRLRAALTAQGVDSAAISPPSLLGQIGFIGNEAIDPDDMPARPAGWAAIAKRHSASSAVRVRLASGEMLARVQSIVADLGLRALSPPSLDLKDDSNAHRAAIADAVRRARADADIYAAALGYRVVRLTQVTNNVPAPKASEDGANFLRVMNDAQMGEVRDVETGAAVTLCFVIAPR